MKTEEQKLEEIRKKGFKRGIETGFNCDMSPYKNGSAEHINFVKGLGEGIKAKEEEKKARRLNY